MGIHIIVEFVPTRQRKDFFCGVATSRSFWCHESSESPKAPLTNGLTRDDGKADDILLLRVDGKLFPSVVRQSEEKFKLGSWWAHAKHQKKQNEACSRGS